MINLSTYYKKIIALIIESYHEEFNTALPGHCMKITGLSENELNFLWNELNNNYPHILTYIVTDNHSEDKGKYITATKLIELRNQQEKPLLILIPANSRTAAEDSYGNATFKEISLDIIEQRLYEKLLFEIPHAYDNTIKSILNYPYLRELEKDKKINYLIEVSEKGFDEPSIGNSLFFLDLIPDSRLLKEREKLRSRLKFNVESIQILSNFGKPLYERISELPIENNTIQKDLIKLFREGAKSRQLICKNIVDKYSKLNFSNWPLPDIDLKDLELTVEDITSKDFTIDNGKKILNASDVKSSKVKVRIKTQPDPVTFEDLKFFRIILMQVDGASGNEVMELRKLKNTASQRPYRDASIDMDSSLIEEGSYFFRVFAEDESGNKLNLNDEFKDAKIESQWKLESTDLKNKYEDEELQQMLKELKTEYNFKKTSDSDDFDFIISEELPEPKQTRRDKINNVLQAYFQYRVENLKDREELTIPQITEDSGCWVDDTAKKLSSTYFVKFNSKHVYQVILSSKLRTIESIILKNREEFGSLDITLYNNPSSHAFKSSFFKSNELVNKLIPKDIINLRSRLFESISTSAKDMCGVFETFDFYNQIDVIRAYLTSLSKWTTELRDRFDNLTEIDSEEKAELQFLFLELQNIDTVHISTKLPDQSVLEMVLLTPLHPLRLTWHLQLFDLFSEWEQKTSEFGGYIDEWNRNLEHLFTGKLMPENNPLVLASVKNSTAYQYAGELQYGWGVYIKPERQYNVEAISSINRQIKAYIRNLLNVSSENSIDNDISQKLVERHIKNYLTQHPYTDKLIINLFNAGDATTFANSLVALEQELWFENISYEIRLFKSKDNIINQGESFKDLINPEYNVSEEAEAFSQPSHNKLFPKLRFSVSYIDDYLSHPEEHTAHISFLVSPFPSKTELIRVRKQYTNFYLNGVLVSPSTIIEDEAKDTKWNKFIYPNKLGNQLNEFSNLGIDLFSNIQSFVAGALASQATSSLPSAQLHLNEKDNVLISLIHDNSDWVITFDKNLGPQIFDQPSKDGHVPFLLDYIPGEELSGISSYLTTRPTSEILGLLSPHFEEFNINIIDPNNEAAFRILLEDLRSISSSLVLQLNSGINKAFEVTGSAFTKRILEKKEMLKDSFLIPIDLHQNLFENSSISSKSRADNLLVSIDTENRVIEFTVIEVKCRNSLAGQQKNELIEKIKEQINNTINILKYHYDPENNMSHDRLDRQIKNKELKALLEFYIYRASRYDYLEENILDGYLAFLNTLDHGYKLSFKQLGLIFDFSSSVKHQKQVLDSDLTFFTFGRRLIDEILDPESDMNTARLENDDLKDDLATSTFRKKELSDFLKAFETSGESEFVEKEEIKQKIDEDEREEIDLIPVNDNNKEYYEHDAESPFEKNKIEEEVDSSKPYYDIYIGKSSGSEQYGILGKSIHGKAIALDLSETNTISLFGVQGGGKSYTIGTVTEMVLKQFSNVNLLQSPLAGVIFHYSESQDYEPEFTSMINSNDNKKEVDELLNAYNAHPGKVENLVILTPKDKVEERKEEYPDIPVFPIVFNSMELNAQDWLFLLGAIGNDSTYVRQLKAIMKENRNNLTLSNISQSVEETELLSNTQKALARQKLNFASEYIDDDFKLSDILHPGRLVIVDLRDEFIVKDDALGLFVVMLNIFSSIKSINSKHFNKFIVFDEAHKYMDNKALTNNIVSAIREMRHKGVSIMIASQDPPSLPNEIIELSHTVILHKFNSPQWLRHVQKSIIQLNPLQSTDLAALKPGEAFIWANKSDDKSLTNKPTKIIMRPRVTKHGGRTKTA